MSKGIYSGSKCGFDPNAFCIVGNICGGKKFCYKKSVFFPIVKVHKILELTSSPFAFPWASMSQLGKRIFESALTKYFGQFLLISNTGPGFPALGYVLLTSRNHPKYFFQCGILILYPK